MVNIYYGGRQEHLLCPKCKRVNRDCISVVYLISKDAIQVYVTNHVSTTHEYLDHGIAVSGMYRTYRYNITYDGLDIRERN